MIIVLKPGVTRDQVEDFSNHLAKTNSVTVNAWYGEHSTVLGLLGDTAAVDMDSIAAQDIVQRELIERADDLDNGHRSGQDGRAAQKGLLF